MLLMGAKERCRQIGCLLLFMVVNFTIGLCPFLDNFAHVGGFLFGFFAGFVVFVLPSP